ncbi:MAG: carboxypeptidase-like regulatory domain-containing protein, partial [Planctomycetota bacterium]|nr:carboxypeptidase-like regulatory domain-containing protein [Planctomycetota bacterium]
MRTPKTDLARRSWAPLTLAVALAALAPSAAAQRLQPTLCAVVDAAGQPVAGATVTLLGSQPHLSPSLRGPHIVEVATDARGRALARLRPGLCYVAWARTATAAGRRSYAPTVGYFSAGAALELRCGEPQAIERATVSGADAWRDDGPLRCFAMSQSPGAEVELSLDDDGSFELPGAPYSIFEARLPSGQPLWSAAMDRALRIPPPQR